MLTYSQSHRMAGMQGQRVLVTVIVDFMNEEIYTQYTRHTLISILVVPFVKYAFVLFIFNWLK